MARSIMVALLMVGFAAVAHADVISMAEESCRDAQRGARCEREQGTGTCQPDTCCRLDYSQGTPPTEKCSDCLTCQPGDGGDTDDGCDAGAASRPLGLGALAVGLLLALGLWRMRR